MDEGIQIMVMTDSRELGAKGRMFKPWGLGVYKQGVKQLYHRVWLSLNSE